jgi:D-amino-acid oxidase
VSTSFSNAPSTYSWLQFHEIRPEQLKPGIDNGTAFTSVCINTSIYLPWLVSQCLKAGVIFKRAIFKHISDAADNDHQGLKASLVINCTGLSASKLGGVKDKSVIPARGQIVLVRNDPGSMFSISGTDDADDEVSYIMMRAAGGGTILGGSYQKGNWESQFDPNLATRIMKRCVDLCPQLTGGKGIEHLDIIRHGVGLRPLRLGGARIEKEKIGGTWVVHNYGKQPRVLGLVQHLTCQ